MEAGARRKQKAVLLGSLNISRTFNVTKKDDLQSKLQELDHKICNGGVFDHQLLEQHEAAKEELKIIHETRGKEAMFRSKVKWFEQGEKPTKYFFNLEKTNYEKKLIREVKLENVETVTDEV